MEENNPQSFLNTSRVSQKAANMMRPEAVVGKSCEGYRLRGNGRKSGGEKGKGQKINLSHPDAHASRCWREGKKKKTT